MRIDFDTAEALKGVSNEEAERVGLDPALFKEIKDHKETSPVLADLSIPQSTYRDFARARPRRVLDGYNERSTTIDERIGPHQTVNGRIWFGKTFYDGESHTGVGGLGYFDIPQKKFTFLKIPEIVDWSVSALLVEDQALWAALESVGEGAAMPGGLLRHDLRTSTTRIYRVKDPIYVIRRSADALVLATTNGIYVLKADHLTRHRPEPNIEGKFLFYSESL